MLLEVESRRRAAMLRMRSAEPRSSVSNNRIKDVSDDWFESWWELQISKIIWTSGNCITLSAGLPLCRPELMLHDRPLLCIRTRTRQALQITVMWFGKVAEGGTHHWDARFLTQVYPSLKLLGSTAFISEMEDHLSFILCLFFFWAWRVSEAARWPLPAFAAPAAPPPQPYLVCLSVRALTHCITPLFIF